MKIYVIGSLENPRVPSIAGTLREDGHEVFDSWYAAGPDADRYWRQYEEAKGLSFAEALSAPAAQNVLNFDRKWALWADVGVLVLPAGKSGHLELGAFWINVPGKQAHILLPPDFSPEKWDVMYGLADGIWSSPHLLQAYLLRGDGFRDKGTGRLS